MSHIRNKTIEGLEPGHVFSVARTFTEQDMIDFARITRDYNPVHFDDRFSAANNFQGRICHGLLVGSLLTEIGGQIGWLASGMDFRFKRPVYFGDTVACDFTITDINDRGKAKAKAVFKNQDDIIVLEARLTGILPAASEKQILSAMVAEGDPTNKIA